MAILFVTHNATLAQRCDNIIQVVDGVLLDKDSEKQASLRQWRQVAEELVLAPSRDS